MKIAGTVILYNPDESVVENIQTYLPIVEKLYVVDNSTRELEFLPEILRLPKIDYISLGGNQGIAMGLKIATEKAVAEGYDYILSMDQDSKFPVDDAEYVFKALNDADYKTVGAIAVNNDAGTSRGIGEKDFIVEKPWVITSGCFMSTKAYTCTEGYDIDLFVDGVDTDICYKIAQAGFKFYMLENIFLKHQVGDECRTLKIFGVKVMSLFTHSPVRYYYQYRNFTYLMKKCPDRQNIFQKEYSRFNARLPIKVLLLESNKRRIFRMIKQGKRDGKRGILGPYQEKRK